MLAEKSRWDVARVVRMISAVGVVFDMRGELVSC